MPNCMHGRKPQSRPCEVGHTTTPSQRLACSLRANAKGEIIATESSSHMQTFDQGLSYVRARTAVIRVLARAGSLTYLLDVFCMWGVRQNCIHGTAPNKKQHDACCHVCVMLTQKVLRKTTNVRNQTMWSMRVPIGKYRVFEHMPKAALQNRPNYAWG